MTTSSYSNVPAVTTQTAKLPVWEKREGLIYITLRSTGMSGLEWIKRLADRGIKISGGPVHNVFCHQDFRASCVGTVHRLITLPPKYFSRGTTWEEVLSEGGNRNWKKANIEVVPLMMESFSDKDMKKMGFDGFTVVHEPVKASERWSSPEFAWPRMLGGSCAEKRKWSRFIGSDVPLPTSTDVPVYNSLIWSVE